MQSQKELTLRREIIYIHVYFNKKLDAILY